MAICKTDMKRLPKRTNLHLEYGPMPKHYSDIKWVPNEGELHVDEMPDSMRKKWEALAIDVEIKFQKEHN